MYHVETIRGTGQFLWGCNVGFDWLLNEIVCISIGVFQSLALATRAQTVSDQKKAVCGSQRRIVGGGRGVQK